jgi:hypothetical protein
MDAHQNRFGLSLHEWPTKAEPGMRISRIVVRVGAVGLWVLCVSLAAGGQPSPQVAGKTYAPFVTDDPGSGSVTITGMWRFHTGDDLAWAQPGYDDSHWELQQGKDTWGDQGHPGYWGWAWYRKEIDVRHTGNDLGILMPPTDDVYELYWNGQRIGHFWQVPPHARLPGGSYSMAFALPVKAGQDARGVLAVRVWKAIIPMNFGPSLGGFEEAARLGDVHLLAEQSRQQRAGWERQDLLILMMAAGTLTFGFVALMLYLAEGREVLYLWFAAYLIVTAARGMDTLAVWTTIPWGWYQAYLFATTSGEAVFLWLLLLCLFGLWKEKAWRRWTGAVIALNLAVTAIDIGVNFLWAHAGRGFWWIDGVADVIESVTPLFAIAIVVAGLRRADPKPRAAASLRGHGAAGSVPSGLGKRARSAGVHALDLVRPYARSSAVSHRAVSGMHTLPSGRAAGRGAAADHGAVRAP